MVCSGMQWYVCMYVSNVCMYVMYVCMYVKKCKTCKKKCETCKKKRRFENAPRKKCENMCFENALEKMRKNAKKM